MSKHITYVLTVLLLFAGATDVAAQQREITGRVTDASSGEALAGASVVVVGTQIGALTDAAGRFSVRGAPAGTVELQVRNVGYRTRQVTVAAGAGPVEVALEVDILALEELVVTGQATSVSRRNLANAVGTVSAQELERVPSETIEKMMIGKVAGATIESNSGAPGGGLQVRLRGVSTINGESEPLYVVDGVIISNVGIPSNANAVTEAAKGSNPSLTQDAVVNRVVDINPNDIESIEILKGASAAAIYGSKAANGVVVITTKKGRPGAPRLSFTQRVGTFDLSNKLGSRTFETVDEVFATYLDPAESTAMDTSFYRQLYGNGQTYDHEEQLAGRNDLSTETSFSLSGGNADTRYYISGTWKNDEGIVENTGFEKQGVRINVDQRVGSRLTLTANTNVLHTLAERGITNNDNSGTSYYMVLPFTPNFVDLSRNADGTFKENPFERSNPLQTAALVDNKEDVWRLISGGSLTFDALDTGEHTLRLIASGGVDYFIQKNDLFFPPELFFEDDDGLPGSSLLSHSTSRNLTAQASMVHSYTPASGLFSATTSAGVQYEDRDLNISRIVSRNLIAGLRNTDQGTVQGTRHQKEIVKDLGLYVQEEVLALDDRMLVTFGLRADRSSANGDTEKYHVYPKAAFSYRFDELPGAVDGLKLRTAWGQSGNLPLFGQKFTPLATGGIEGLPGLVSSGVAGDPNIQPERQTEIEGGFDVTFFDGMASLEVTAFQKTIQDMLLQRRLAPSTGFTTQFFNGGELRVRGLELALAATPVRNDRLTWVSRTSFYADRSRVMSLPVPAFETGGFGTSLGAFKIEEGKSATQIVANSGLDANGNIIVKQVGDANPDFRIGFANDLTFGDFQLFSLWDWSQGNTVIDLTLFLADAGQNSADFDEDPQPYVLPPNPETGAQDTIMAGTGLRRLLGRGAWKDTRGYIQDGNGSYVKLRELSLSYNVPSSALGRLGTGISGARLTLSGRNLLTFTDYTGLDPEVSNFGNQPIARNIDVAPFPPSRSFWLAVDLTF